jgi:hypothetical protein
MSSFTGLVIATPAYGGQVTSPYLLSMVRTVVECCKRGISHQVHVNAGDSFIPRARALLVAKFLQTDCSHILFIDADMSWQAEDVVRLLLHDKDFVCGAYRQKTPELRWNWCCLPSPNGETVCEVGSGLVQISGAGAGFMMLKRAAVERMIAAAPETKFVHVGNETTLDAWDLFGPVGCVDGTFYGEDIAFCHRWRRLGGEVWLDPAVQLGHHGNAAFTADPRTAFSETPCQS